MVSSTTERGQFNDRAWSIQRLSVVDSAIERGRFANRAWSIQQSSVVTLPTHAANKQKYR